MARIPINHEDDPATPDDVRALLKKVGGDRGRLLNVYRAMSNHPAALEAFNALSNAVRTFPNGGGGGSLTPAQTELAYTTATVANNCFY